jgi:hypothetical protein
MPRKKSNTTPPMDATATIDAPASAAIEPGPTGSDMPTETGLIHTHDAAGSPVQESVDPEMMDRHSGPTGEDPPKNWGPPYKAIYTNAAKGFELGENRRFKQRVFTFRDKPDADTIEALKIAGFRYRAEEKAWTVQSTPITREISDQLARQFAGETASRDADRSR